MEEPKTCPTCGAKMVEYKHGLSKGLCRALAKAWSAFSDTQPHEISEMGLDYNHRCNFQKLRYWGLVEKVGDPTGKGGRWRVTSDGVKFLMGALRVQKAVWTYRGDAVRFEGPMVSHSDVTGGWELRTDFARNAQGRVEWLFVKSGGETV